MARRRRRRVEDSADGLDELEDDDDDLDIRITSVEEELQNLQYQHLSQSRESQTLRAKVEKLAREFEEDADGDDEVFTEIDELKKAMERLNEQLSGSQVAILERISAVSARLDSVGGVAPLEEFPVLLERRVGEMLDAQLRDLTERIQEQLTSMEAAREEDSDLVATRLEEFMGQVDSVVTQLQDKFEQDILETRQTLGQDLEGMATQVQSALSSGPVQEQLERLAAEVDQNLGALETTVQAALETSQQEVHEAISQIRGELVGLADVQATIHDIAEMLDSKAGLEDLNPVKQGLEDLKKSLSDTAGIGERSREALNLVARLETQIKDTEERFTRIAARSEESAKLAERHQDKVNLAVKLVDALDEKVRSTGAVASGAAPATAAAASVSDADLESPAKTDIDFELNDLLQVVIKHNASDLHLKVGAPPHVRLRGELIPVGDSHLAADDCKRLVFSALNKPMRRQLLTNKSIDIVYDGMAGSRFRMNAFQERGYLSAAFRAVRSEVNSYEEYGLPALAKKLAINYQSGLILVTGPTGAGKSTTLAGMVESINTNPSNQKKNIITIEDPIEFYFTDKQALITQREVGTDTLGFAEALRESLRQDPNVILASDLPDDKSILAAVMAADSGQLVLAGMHTPTVVTTLERILESFSGNARRQIRLQLASSLRAIVSLRMLARSDKAGRVAACEILVVTPSLAALLQEGRIGDVYQAMAHGSADGMLTFSQSLARLVEAGLITREEAIIHVENNPRPDSPPAAAPPTHHAPAAHAPPPTAAPPPVQPGPPPPPTPATAPGPAPQGGPTDDTLMNWL